MIPVSVFLLLTINGGNCATVDIVLKTDAAATILLSKIGSETERFAAEELIRYIKAMTGRTIPVTNCRLEAKGFIISIGRTHMGTPFLDRFKKGITGPGNDSFLIDAKRDRLILIGGGDRGTLYGVYEFLEQQGCRWFMPGTLGEVIPRRESLSMPKGCRIFVPDFVQREIDGAAPPEELEDLIDWAVKNRLNRIFGARNYHLKALPKEKRDAWRKRGGYLNWQWICHNFSWMLSPKKYFKENPEYYALYNGRRIPLGTAKRPSYGGGNLCTTNPDVIRICAEFAIDWFNKNPDGMFVPLNPNDGAIKWCECQPCRALGGKNFVPGVEGSMTRRMVVFANEVARLISKKHPDRRLLVLAYSNYIEPVEDLPIEKNVVVQFCYHGCYGHAPNRCRPNREQRRHFEGWAKLAGGRLGIWEYFLIGDQSAHRDSPAWLPLLYRARDSVRYFNRRGAKYYFTQSSGRYQQHNPILFYALARMLWDVDLNFARLMRDFCTKMYGPAASDIRKIMTTIERSAQRSGWHPQTYSDVAVPTSTVFTPRVLARAEKCMVRAEKRDIDQKIRKRLALLRESFEFTKENLRTVESVRIARKTEKGRSSSSRSAKTGTVQPEGSVLLDAGITGKAASFREDKWLTFSSEYIKGNSGTVETWFKLSKDARDIKQEFLFSVGANDPEWFLVAVSNGRLGFLYKNGRSPYRGEGEFYSHLSIPIDDLRKDEWHHLAIVWASRDSNQSLVQIYLDGELREKRANATIGDSFHSPNLFIGTSGILRHHFSGWLDELRISNFPKSGTEIRNAFEAVQHGASLRKESGTLLLLNFEKGLKGESQTVDSLDDEEVREQAQKIIEQF